MTMNAGIISRNVGIALMCNAAFMALSAIVSIIYGFDSSFSALVLSALMTALFGIFPLIFVRSKGNDLSAKEGIVIMILSWVLCCIFGMLPYILWGGEISLSDALFESTSGITTTGATCLADIESLPPGLLFWRSSTHYIGGLGVVVFMMMIIPSSGSGRFRMSKLEVLDVSKAYYHYSSNKYVRVVVTVYLGITAAALISLLIAGMPFFDAVNHAMSVVATGGFSTRNASIAAFDSPAIESVLIFFMILSSLHFGLIYASFATRSFKVLRNPVTKFYLGTIAIATLLVTLSLCANHNYDGFLHSLRVSLFEVAATISTTGFAIVDTNGWSVFASMILMYLAIQCGCSGSTTSGLRSDRVWILFNAMKSQLDKKLHPNSVSTIKIGGMVVGDSLLSSVSMFTLIYFVTTFVCGLIYSMFGFDLLESLSISVSMMSNLGPAFGSVGTMSNFALVPAASKVIMCIQMIMGRLGIYSVLMIIPILSHRRG